MQRDEFGGISDEERMLTGCFRGGVCAMAVIIIMIVCAMCAGCTTTKYVPVVEHRTDTLTVSKHIHDSIHVKDSTDKSQWKDGDTVYIREIKIRTKYVERAVHDTTYIATHDTVPEPYPVEVEVPAEISRWQRWKMNMGVAFMGLLTAVILFGCWQVKRRLWP